MPCPSAPLKIVTVHCIPSFWHSLTSLEIEFPLLTYMVTEGTLLTADRAGWSLSPSMHWMETPLLVLNCPGKLFALWWDWMILLNFPRLIPGWQKFFHGLFWDAPWCWAGNTQISVYDDQVHFFLKDQVYFLSPKWYLLIRTFVTNVEMNG